VNAVIFRPADLFYQQNRWIIIAHMPVLHVHIQYPPEQNLLPAFRASLSASIQLTTGPGMPEQPQYHVLVEGRPQRTFLEASPNLHTLVVPWAGISEETRQLLREFPQISVYNLHHNASATAETAAALLMAAAKFTIPFDRTLRSHDWTPRYEPTQALLLVGKTALILGFGHIGQRIGRVCDALGMQVLGVRRSSGAVPDLSYPAEVFSADALPELLPRSQVLIIALPGTPETRGLVGEQQLRMLPDRALLVNIGRGDIVDQDALFSALKERRLAGAGLDVWWTYPADEQSRTNTPPAKQPFHTLDNVVMSPHRGGATRESEKLRLEHLAVLLNKAAHGEEIPNQVNLEAGY
jgi:phosphoglycerate dehydrogenase-like enzyme